MSENEKLPLYAELYMGMSVKSKEQINELVKVLKKENPSQAHLIDYRHAMNKAITTFYEHLKKEYER